MANAIFTVYPAAPTGAIFTVNPAPAAPADPAVLAALTPDAVVAGANGFTLVLAMDGTATPGQTARIDGNSTPTVYVDPDTLLATVLALDLLLPGERVITVANADGIDGGDGLTLTVTEADAAVEAYPPWLPPVAIETYTRVTASGDRRVTAAGDIRTIAGEG